MTATMMSTDQLLYMARTLSDSTIYDLTSISIQSYWALIRRALLCWVLDCGYYAEGEEQTVLDDFMHQLDIKETITKTLLGSEDQKIYEDIYAQLVAIGRVEADSGIIQATQLFNMDEEYLGTYFTCADKNLNYFWCYFEDSDRVVVTRDKTRVHEWIWSMTSAYIYIVYGVISPSWKQTLTGSRTKGT